LKSQVERSRSVPVLLLFGYKVTRMEWLQLGNIFLRSGTIPLQKKSMGRSRSVPSPLAQLALPSVRSSSRASLCNQTKNRAALFQFTLQPNKKQSRFVQAYQTQNRAATFLESGIERLYSTWLLNQTLP
jgi:hypothetical protein